MKNTLLRFNMVDIQFPMKVKDIPLFERLNNFNLKLFDLPAGCSTMIPVYIDENYYKEQIHVLILKSHYCLVNLHNLCRSNELDLHLYRRCLNTNGTQSILGSHMKRCNNLEIYKGSLIRDAKMKFEDCHMKIDLRSWIAADFEV